MAKTYPRVSFGLYGLEIKQDSTPSTTIALQPFAKIADLKTDAASAKPYATYEPDFWLLDGNRMLLPENTAGVHVGMMSLDMTDEDGDFTTPPILVLDFSEPKNSEGLVLHFLASTSDWAKAVTIAYYDDNAALIREDTYTVTSADFSTGQEVNGFQQIVISFAGTNKPYRYLRMLAVDYGEFLTFEGAAVVEASVVEDANSLSLELPVGELALTVYSADAEFSILNPAGKYQALYQRQPMTVYEVVDGAPVFIGNFYLNTWKNKSETVTEFTAVDMLGVLDTIPYRGGKLNGENVGSVLAAMFAAVAMPYDLDSSLAALTLTGWIPYGNCRAALQQIGIAIGATVTCSRSAGVKIFPAKVEAVTFDNVITRTEKGGDQSLELKPLVTGVDVTAHTYRLQGWLDVSETELFNDSLPAGTFEIAFKEPVYNLTITGATITESGANYAVITVAGAATVQLKGLPYIHTTQVHSLRDTTLPPNVSPNIIKIEDATLVGSANVENVAARVLAYYQQRYLQNLRLYAPGIQVGDLVEVDTLYNKKLRAMVEHMDIDLAMGFTADVTMTGVEYVE